MTGPVLGILLVIVSAVLEGLGQVLLKKSMRPRGRWLSWISAGVAVLAVEALVYTAALKFLRVGVAFAVSSLNLIAIAMLSQWILRERITRTRWIGVALIFAGAAMVMARSA